MKVDVPLQGGLAEAGHTARRTSEAGADGTFTFEGAHDVFAPLVLAAASGAPIDVYPMVAISLPRSPLHLAHTAYDLQALSGGRFMLGLGSQIQAHIEYRYGATWSRPVERMRETTLAVKAILQSWQDGSRLDFRGEFTTHTLMPPMFDPGPNPCGAAPVMLGAVGRRMTEMTAEVADGLIIHPLNSERSIREHTLVHVHNGLHRSGRDLPEFRLIAGVIVGAWEEESERPRIEEALRGMLAFYSSTPAYRVMLDIEGYGDLQPALRQLTKEGRWTEMAALIDDGMLDRYTVRGTPTEVGRGLASRYGGLVDRVALSPQGGLSLSGIAGITAAVRESTAGATGTGTGTGTA